MSTPAIATGTRLGPYEVAGLLGKGGMGEVFRATDVRLKRSVAIKVLTSDWIHDEALRNRFYLEAQILSQLDHPNVCTVHDIGETDGVPYLVMPYIEGETLANVIRRFSTVPRAQRLRYIEQLLDGLEYADAKILHRDIKPANLMIDAQNRLKILDFGLARRIDATQPTMFPDAGTPAYMSPEQCQGQPLDPRTDIFSAGAVLYELLTGAKPFSRADDVNCAVVMHRILHEDAPRLPATGAPPDVALQQILDKALAKDRDRRFSRAGEMADAVRAVRERLERPEATVVSLPAPAPSQLVVPAPGVHSGPIAAGIATLIVAALAGAWFGLRSPTTEPAPSQPNGSNQQVGAGQKTNEGVAGPPRTMQPPPQSPSKVANPGTQHPEPIGPSTERPRQITGSVAPPPAAGRSASRASNSMLRPESVRLASADTLDGACGDGNGLACTELGKRYRDGRGVDANDTRAFALFERACTAAEPSGCTALGFSYASGRGVTGNEPRAVELYRRACESGDPAGCAYVGDMLNAGRGVAKDVAGAIAFYDRACKGDNALGCWSLGDAYAAGHGVPRDDARAIPLYQRACDGDRPEACLQLGNMYLNARGVAGDDARAVTLYVRACDGGIAIGCRNAGLAYALARGVANDDVRAAGFFQRACDKNDFDGCKAWGDLFRDGRGVSRDDARAAALFRRACDGGRAPGCTNLANMYAEGRGVARDLPQAFTISLRACDGGDAPGCLNAAAQAEHGNGTARDIARAIDLYQHACKYGREDGCAEARRLRR